MEAVMKKRILYLTAVLLVSVIFSGISVNGQEKSQDQKEKEAKLQQSIEQQKKAMAEQKKAEEEAQKALQEIVVEGRSSGNVNVNDIYRRSRSVGSGHEGFDQFVFTPGVEYPGATFYGRGGGDNERTTWDFSKYVKESTFSKQYSFDVEKTANTVVMSVMGDCKAGEIRVKIIMPSGKTYSDILIDEYGNLNWRKSFTISEEENKDKSGEWIFKIDATKATGSFKISLQTY
jgi:outer membrane murein-binding lipoprotein Lpp